MPSLAELYTGLNNASAAGDDAAAKEIAAAIKGMQANPASQEQRPKNAIASAIDSMALPPRVSPAGAAAAGLVGETIKGAGALSQLVPNALTPKFLEGSGQQIADVGEAITSKAQEANIPGALVGQVGSYFQPTKWATQGARLLRGGAAPKTLTGNIAENVAVGGGLTYGTTAGSTEERAVPAAVASTISGAIPLVGQGLSKLTQAGIDKFITPKITPEVRLLHERGIPLSIGQILGGGFKTAEDKLTSYPLVGQMVQALRQKGYSAFNTATFDEVLDPLRKVGKSPIESTSKELAVRTPGAPALIKEEPLSLDVKVPKETGRQAFDEIETQVSDAYDKVLGRMRFKADPQFDEVVTKLKEGTNQLPGDLGKSFAYDIDEIIYKKIQASKNGQLDGQAVKEIQTDIRTLRDQYKGSRGAEGRLSKAYDAVDDAFGETLKRLNPRYAADLKAVDTAYARLTRLRGAGSMANTEVQFTPSQLASAVRRQDKSSGKRSYASGKALMQELSDAATQVLPPKYPDSGTAGRLLSPGGLGAGGVGLGFSAATNPLTTMGVTAAYLSTAIPYLDGPAKVIARRLIDGKRVSPAEAEIVKNAISKRTGAIVGGTRVSTDELRE